MDIVIEQGVPIPARYSRMKYPYKNMKVGDSMEIETNNPNSVATTARQWAGRRGWLFRSRKTDTGVRIWRVA